LGIVDEDVARVREQTDLVALISQYTQLKRVGRRWSGLCPFHSEKTPSFSVNAEDGLYYCFGCKESGDAITFLREIEHLDFVGAVESLAARSGVHLRYTTAGGGEDRKRKDQLQKQMARAVEYYHDQLRTSAGARSARSYLRGRGFTAEEVARYQLGWAPDAWDDLTRALKLSQGDLEDSGLGMLNRRNRLQDFFRARILFPIYDEQGRPIGFGGRKLPDAEGAKYQNSRDNKLYHKSQALYGLNWAKADAVQKGEIVICEGYTDVIGFNRVGVDRAVATCGTALTEDHVKMLARFTRRLVLAYDADEAGQSAAERVYEWEQKHEVGFWVVALPPGTDPDELSTEDPEALRAALTNARPFLEFRVERGFAAADLETAEGRAHAANEALVVISEHPDPLVVDQYLMDVAQRTRIDVDRLRSGLERAARTGRSRREAALAEHRNREQKRNAWRGDSGPPPTDSGQPSEVGPSSGVRAPENHGYEPIPAGAERETIRLLIAEPERADTLDATLFSHPTAHAAFVALQGRSSLAEALETADSVVADELRRLSVEEIEVDALAVLSRLATEAVRVELVEMEHEAREADDPLEYAQPIAYVKRAMDLVRDGRSGMVPVVDLLDWLKARRDPEQD
jgi:DNA primase